MFRDRHLLSVVAAGLLLGTIAVLLSVWGNPENSGICVSCFIENSAGALGFHDNQRMQYLRPELIGFVLGSAFSALLFREFRSRGGGAALPRLLSGIFLIVGCAVFIGCPIKLVLRLTAGDFTAVAGLAGLVAGVWCGVKGLEQGVSFGAQRQDRVSGYLVPGFFVLLLVFVFAAPTFILSSQQGSAAQHAPALAALGAGILLGAVCQRSRFCITGSLRDAFILRGRAIAMWGFAAFLLAAAVTAAVSGRIHPGLYGQPGAHNDYLWSFLGMMLVGGISVLLGGCPFRQLVKAGEGDVDAAFVVIGMFIGGAISQSWGIAATAAGVSLYGKGGVLAGIAFLCILFLVLRERSSTAG